MKQKRNHRVTAFIRSSIAWILIVGQCLWMPVPATADLLSDCISAKLSDNDGSFIASVEEESLRDVLPDMESQAKDAQYLEILATHIAKLRTEKDAQVSEIISADDVKKACRMACKGAQELVSNDEIFIPVSITQKRSLKKMIESLAQKRPDAGVTSLSDVVVQIEKYFSLPWTIDFLVPEDGFQEFAIYEEGYLIREPLCIEENGNGLRITIAHPQWQHLTEGERVAQIIGALIEHAGDTTAEVAAVGELSTPAFAAGSDAAQLDSDLVAAVATYGRIKLDLLFAIQEKDRDGYMRAQEKLISEIRAINTQVSTLSLSAMAVLCKRAQAVFVSGLSSDETARIEFLAKDIAENLRRSEESVFRQFEKFFTGHPDRFASFLLGNAREFHSLAGVSFSAEQQRTIEAIIDETARELYDDSAAQDAARKRFMDDVHVWDIAHIVRAIDDTDTTDAWVGDALAGLLEVFRMEHAGGYFDPSSEQLYFPQSTDILGTRLVFKHELVHYLAFKNELQFDYSFEWTTSCIHVLEVAEQIGADKLALYKSPLLSPVMSALFKRGIAIAEKGEQGLLIETTSEGPTVSLEYLSAVVAEVYQKEGLSPEQLEYEDGWDREIGAVLAGIMYARRHHHKVDTPYLRVLQDFFSVVHEQLRPPTTEEEAWIDKTLMPKLTSFAGFQLGDVTMRPVSDDAPLKQWSIAKVGNRYEVTYVPQDLWPRDYYGTTENARNQKAEDHAFAALSEALFRYQHSMKDMALDTATTEGLSEEDRSIFAELWKALETYDVIQKGIAIYKGKELDGDDLKSQNEAGFEVFTSARIGAQIFERFKTAYDVKNIDVERTILAGKPLPVQFLNSLMYRRVLGSNTDPRLTRPRVEEALRDTRDAWYGLTSGETWTSINEVFNNIYTDIWPVFKQLYDEAIQEEENRRVYDRLRRDNARGNEPEWDDLTDAQKSQMQEAITEALEQMTDAEREALREAVQEQLQQMMQEQGAQSSGQQSSSQPQPGSTPQPMSGDASGGMTMPDMPQSGGDLKDRLDQMQEQTKNLEEALSDMQNDITQMGRDTSQVGKETGSMTGTVSDEQQKRAERIAEGTQELKNSSENLQKSSHDIKDDATDIDRQARENVSQTPSVELGEKSAKETGKLKETAESLANKSDALDNQMQELTDQAEALKEHIDNKEEASTVKQHLDKLKEMLSKTQNGINDVREEARKTGEQSGAVEDALGNQEASQPITSDFPSMKDTEETEQGDGDATQGDSDTTSEEKPSSFEDMLKSAEAMTEEYEPKEDGEFDGFTDEDFTFDFDDTEFEPRQETSVTPGTEDLPQGWKKELDDFFSHVRKDIRDILTRISRVLSPDARSGLDGGFMEGSDIDDLVDVLTTGEGWAQPAHDQPEDMVVSLFLDLSQSMTWGGSPIEQARYAALILTKALFELKHKYQQFDVAIRFEVWGFGEYDRPLMSFTHADAVTPEQVYAELYRLYSKITANDDMTLDLEALERQYDNLRSYAASGVKRVGFFVTDGNDGDNTEAMRTIVEQADRDDDIQLFGISVGDAKSKRIVDTIFGARAIPVKKGFKELGLAIVNTLFTLSGTTDADYSWMELCIQPMLPITKALIRAGFMLKARLLLATQTTVPVPSFTEEDIPGYEKFGFKYRFEHGMKYLVHYAKDSAGDRTIIDFKMRLGHTGNFKPSFLTYSQTNEDYLVEMFRQGQKGACANTEFDSPQENRRVSKDGKRYIREIPTGGLELWDAEKRQMIVGLEVRKGVTIDPLWPTAEGEILNTLAKNGNLYFLTRMPTGDLELIAYDKGKGGTWQESERFAFDDTSPNGRLVNLMGESGTGKGELLKAAAHLAQKRLVFVSCHKDMNRGDIVYYATYGEEQDNATGKKYSHLNKGVQMGDWVVLDEYNKIPTNVRKELQTSFQERTYERDMETIGADGSKTIKAVTYRWHPDARVFLTGNPYDDGRLYKVNKYDDAELRRMDMIEVKWQSPEEELQMLMAKAFPKGTPDREKKKHLNDFKFLVQWSMTTRLQYLGYDDDARKELLKDWRKFRNPHRYGIQPSARKGDIVGRPISTRIMIRMAEAMVAMPEYFKNQPAHFMKRFFSYAADDPSVCTHDMYENIFRIFENKYGDAVDEAGNAVMPELQWGRGISIDEDKGRLFLKIAPPDSAYIDKSGKAQSAKWDPITIELHPSVTKGMVERRVEQAFSNPANGAIFYEILMQYALGNHMCFVGAPGTGKSYFAELGQKMLSGPEGMNGIFARGTKYQDVVEQREIGQQKKGKTGWIRRPLIWAMGDKNVADQNPEFRGQIYRAEELNQGPAMLHALFNDVLQNGRILLRDETEVEAGKGFGIVITMNPPGKKTQVNPLSGELIDRLVFFEFTDMQPEYEAYEYTRAVDNKLDQDFIGAFSDGVPRKGLIHVVTALREAYDADPSILSARPAISDIIPYVQYLLQYYSVTPEDEQPFMLVEEFVRAIHANMDVHYDFVKNAFIEAGILKAEKVDGNEVLSFDRDGLLDGRPLISENLGLINNRAADTGIQKLDNVLNNLQRVVSGASVSWVEAIEREMDRIAKENRDAEDWNAVRDHMALCIEIYQVLDLIEKHRTHRPEIADRLKGTKERVTVLCLSLGISGEAQERFLGCDVAYFKTQHMETVSGSEFLLLTREQWLRAQFFTAAQQYADAVEELAALMAALHNAAAEADEKLLHESVHTLWFINQVERWLDNANEWRRKKCAAARNDTSARAFADADKHCIVVLERIRRAKISMTQDDLEAVEELIRVFNAGEMAAAVAENVMRQKDVCMRVYNTRSVYALTADEAHMNTWVGFLSDLYRMWVWAHEITAQPDAQVEKERNKKIVELERELEVLRAEEDNLRKVFTPRYHSDSLSKDFLKVEPPFVPQSFVIASGSGERICYSKAQIIRYDRDGDLATSMQSNPVGLHDMVACSQVKGKDVLLWATSSGITLSLESGATSDPVYENFGKNGIVGSGKSFTKIAVHQTGDDYPVIYAYSETDKELYRIVMGKENGRLVSLFDKSMKECVEKAGSVERVYVDGAGNLFIIVDGQLRTYNEEFNDWTYDPLFDELGPVSDMLHGEDGCYYFIIDDQVHVKKVEESKAGLLLRDVGDTESLVVEDRERKAIKLQENKDGLNILWDDGSITIVPPQNAVIGADIAVPMYTKNSAHETVFTTVLEDRTELKTFVETYEGEFTLVATDGNEYGASSSPGTQDTYIHVRNHKQVNDVALIPDVKGVFVQLVATGNGVAAYASDPDIGKDVNEQLEKLTGKNISHVAGYVDGDGEVVVYAYSAETNKGYRIMGDGRLKGVALSPSLHELKGGEKIERMYCNPDGQLFLIINGVCYAAHMLSPGNENDNMSIELANKWNTVSDVICGSDGFYYVIVAGKVYVERLRKKDGELWLEDIGDDYTMVSERDDATAIKLQEGHAGLYILWDDGKITVVKRSTVFTEVMPASDSRIDAVGFEVESNGAVHIIETLGHDIAEYPSHDTITPKNQNRGVDSTNGITLFSYTGKRVRVEAMDDGIEVMEWSDADSEWKPSEDIVRGSEKDNEFFKGKTVTRVDSVVVDGTPYIYAYMLEEGRIGVVTKAKNGRFVEKAVPDGGLFNARGTDISDMAFVSDDTQEYYVAYKDAVVICDPSQDRFSVVYESGGAGPVTDIDVVAVGDVTYVALVIDGTVHIKIRKHDALVDPDGNVRTLPVPEGRAVQHVSHHKGEWCMLFDDGSVGTVLLVPAADATSMPFQPVVVDGFKCASNESIVSFDRGQDGTWYVTQAQQIGFSQPSDGGNTYMLFRMNADSVVVKGKNNEDVLLVASESAVHAFYVKDGEFEEASEYGNDGVLLSGEKVTKLSTFEQNGKQFVSAVSAEKNKEYIIGELSPLLLTEEFSFHGDDEIIGYHRVSTSLEFFITENTVHIVSFDGQKKNHETVPMEYVTDIAAGPDGYYYLIVGGELHIQKLHTDTAGAITLVDTEAETSGTTKVADFDGIAAKRLRVIDGKVYVYLEDGTFRKMVRRAAGTSSERGAKGDEVALGEVRKQIADTEAALAELRAQRDPVAHGEAGDAQTRARLIKEIAVLTQQIADIENDRSQEPTGPRYTQASQRETVETVQVKADDPLRVFECDTEGNRYYLLKKRLARRRDDQKRTRYSNLPIEVNDIVMVPHTDGTSLVFAATDNGVKVLEQDSRELKEHDEYGENGVYYEYAKIDKVALYHPDKNTRIVYALSTVENKILKIDLNKKKNPVEEIPLALSASEKGEIDDLYCDNDGNVFVVANGGINYVYEGGEKLLVSLDSYGAYKRMIHGRDGYYYCVTDKGVCVFKGVWWSDEDTHMFQFSEIVEGERRIIEFEEEAAIVDIDEINGELYVSFENGKVQKIVPDAGASIDLEEYEKRKSELQEKEAQLKVLGNASSTLEEKKARVKEIEGALAAKSQGASVRGQGVQDPGPWYRGGVTPQDFLNEAVDDEYSDFVISPHGDRVFFADGVKYDKTGKIKSAGMFHMAGAGVNDVAYGKNPHGETIQFRATDKGIIAIKEDEHGDDVGLENEFGSDGQIRLADTFTKIVVHQTGDGWPVIYAYSETDKNLYKIVMEKGNIQRYALFDKSMKDSVESGTNVQQVYVDGAGRLFIIVDGSLLAYSEQFNDWTYDASFSQLGSVSNMVQGADGYYYVIIDGYVHVKRGKEIKTGVLFKDVDGIQNPIVKDVQKNAITLQENKDGLNILWYDGSFTILLPLQQGAVGQGLQDVRAAFSQQSAHTTGWFTDPEKDRERFKNEGGWLRAFKDPVDGMFYAVTKDGSVLVYNADGAYVRTIAMSGTAKVKDVWVHTAPDGTKHMFCAKHSGISVIVADNKHWANWASDNAYGHKGHIRTGEVETIGGRSKEGAIEVFFTVGNGVKGIHHFVGTDNPRVFRNTLTARVIKEGNNGEIIFIEQIFEEDKHKQSTIEVYDAHNELVASAKDPCGDDVYFMDDITQGEDGRYYVTVGYTEGDSEEAHLKRIDVLTRVLNGEVDTLTKIDSIDLAYFTDKEHAIGIGVYDGKLHVPICGVWDDDEVPTDPDMLVLKRSKASGMADAPVFTKHSKQHIGWFKDSDKKQRFGAVPDEADFGFGRSFIDPVDGMYYVISNSENGSTILVYSAEGTFIKEISPYEDADNDVLYVIHDIWVHTDTTTGEKQVFCATTKGVVRVTTSDGASWDRWTFDAEYGGEEFMDEDFYAISGNEEGGVVTLYLVPSSDVGVYRCVDGSAPERYAEEHYPTQMYVGKNGEQVFVDTHNNKVVMYDKHLKHVVTQEAPCGRGVTLLDVAIGSDGYYYALGNDNDVIGIYPLKLSSDGDESSLELAGEVFVLDENYGAAYAESLFTEHDGRLYVSIGDHTDESGKAASPELVRIDPDQSQRTGDMSAEDVRILQEERRVLVQEIAALEKERKSKTKKSGEIDATSLLYHGFGFRGADARKDADGVAQHSKGFVSVLEELKLKYGAAMDVYEEMFEDIIETEGATTVDVHRVAEVAQYLRAA